MTFYRSSPGNYRGFCRVCGSPIVSKFDAHPDYDWRAHERTLNQFDHYRVSVGDVELHYVLEQGEGPSPRPLLLTHGWPGSFYEYHTLIPLLTKPSQFGGRVDDAFTVVVPSMPGHGLSFRSNQPRFGIKEIADGIKVLMVDVLAYPAFAAHGHDWGAFVATRLAYAHAEGLHEQVAALGCPCSVEGQQPCLMTTTRSRHFAM